VRIGRTRTDCSDVSTISCQTISCVTNESMLNTSLKTRRT
jgi:hypothetical protein